MASAAKTTNLALPQWATGDKPERTDFNAAFTTIDTLLSLAYPVGSIYISVTNANPTDFFGGTWVAFGQGRVLVGLNGSDADFDTIEETLGAKTHVLSVDEMPAHSHPIGVYLSAIGAGNVSAQGSGSNANWLLTERVDCSKGGGSAHNNIQPSIVVRMWKRTA